jgi:hypothetical protein
VVEVVVPCIASCVDLVNGTTVCLEPFCFNFDKYWFEGELGNIA